MHAPGPPLIPTDMLLAAYRSGIFPMSDARDDDEIFWVEPRDRAIIPLDQFRASRSLRKLIRREHFAVTLNAAFDQVIQACAQPRSDHEGPDNTGTWISGRIEASYLQLHCAGLAHSVECWREGELVGGLYGVCFDRVFCGESMFSRRDNASKVALAWLVALMARGGYKLLDCQFMTDHLASMGAVEIPQPEYLNLLQQAHGKPQQSLPDAYRAVMGNHSAGEAAGAGSASGSEGATGNGSSPGKIIAHSFTQTS